MKWTTKRNNTYAYNQPTSLCDKKVISLSGYLFFHYSLHVVIHQLCSLLIKKCSYGAGDRRLSHIAAYEWSYSCTLNCKYFFEEWAKWIFSRCAFRGSTRGQGAFKTSIRRWEPMGRLSSSASQGTPIPAREMQNDFCKEASVVADALHDFVS